MLITPPQRKTLTPPALCAGRNARRRSKPAWPSGHMGAHRLRPAQRRTIVRRIARGIPMATLYVGGRLFDGEKVLDGHAVLEDGGKVKKVAPAAEFAGFSGETVDTAGGTLIPGLIDCHVHSLSGAEGNPGVVQD